MQYKIASLGNGLFQWQGDDTPIDEQALRSVLASADFNLDIDNTIAKIQSEGGIEVTASVKDSSIVIAVETDIKEPKQATKIVNAKQVGNLRIGIKRSNKMSWRVVLGNQLPSDVKDPKDEWPSNGDSAKQELNAWHSQNKEFNDYKKKEGKEDYQSPVMHKQAAEHTSIDLQIAKAFLSVVDPSVAPEELIELLGDDGLDIKNISYNTFTQEIEPKYWPGI